MKKSQQKYVISPNNLKVITSTFHKILLYLFVKYKLNFLFDIYILFSDKHKLNLKYSAFNITLHLEVV